MMSSLEQAWYRRDGWLLLLWPIALLFQLLAALRKALQGGGRKPAGDELPVIVVGNISVGGTGKTPLIIELANALKVVGLRPAIISRGYLSKAPHYPFLVKPDSDPVECGDEPLLLCSRTECPVVIDPDRVRGLHYIRTELAHLNCDVVLSDDGLQHYAMRRDMEIAVVDGARLFGNGMCLPAGPLREPVSRLERVEHIVINGENSQTADYPQLARAVTMRYVPRFLINQVSGEKKPFNGAPFHIGSTVHAVSGIGNPRRFYDMLTRLPYQLERHEFPDHHGFTEADLNTIDDHQPIVMTEKDAVKCRDFAKPNYWYLSIEVNLPPAFMETVVREIQALCAGRKKAAETAEKPHA
ncbi:MAG: hypothetical protein RLZZ385_2448 [Pseudomonadota bacterium]|jgi:tetraacyldisaccharide 4'-kinase